MPLKFNPIDPTKVEMIPSCVKHLMVGYKKGCKECFEVNKPDPRADDSWHELWERDNFGDRD